jgi:hypothetical protein
MRLDGREDILSPSKEVWSWRIITCERKSLDLYLPNRARSTIIRETCILEERITWHWT